METTVPSPAEVRARMRRPTATFTIIALNVAVFLYQQTLSARAANQFLVNWALIPARFTHPEALRSTEGFITSPPLLTVVTSAFLHGGITHIALNMFLLYGIGRMVELTIGTPRFVLLYAVSGLASSLACILLYGNSLVTNVLGGSPTTPIIGASGAVYGVLGGYFLLMPPGPNRTKTIVWVLALILIPALIPARIIETLTGSAFLANIANWGHFGGFLAGMLTMYLLIRQARRRARQYYGPPESAPNDPLEPGT